MPIKKDIISSITILYFFISICSRLFTIFFSLEVCSYIKYKQEGIIKLNNPIIIIISVL